MTLLLFAFYDLRYRLINAAIGRGEPIQLADDNCPWSWLAAAVVLAGEDSVTIADDLGCCQQNSTGACQLS